MENEIKKAPDRLAVLEKIAEYEKRGWFDRDVEEDPPGRVLHPEDIKYINRSPAARIKRTVAYLAGRIFFYRELGKKKLFLEDPVGLEHLAGVKGGAVLTCNHFHPYDSFMMQKLFELSHHRGRMYRVIREGNYTSFPGFYGMLMRNCDTLPLSSDPVTMKHFLAATHRVLDEGNCLLVYAEQSLWWNYRKPKPLKSGAFEIAVRRSVPVVPCFITFEDTDLVGEDGFPILRHTPHVGAPIYPDTTLSRRAAAEKMKVENEAFCREVYERVYGIPLVYTTEEDPEA